jgi:hypothetical protein
MSATRSKGSSAGRGIRRAPGAVESSRKQRPGAGEEAHIPWGRRNFTILAAGGGAVALGFVLLAVGDKVFAPILIVGGYLGLIPWGILAADRKAPAVPGSPAVRSDAEGE